MKAIYYTLLFIIFMSISCSIAQDTIEQALKVIVKESQEYEDIVLVDVSHYDEWDTALLKKQNCVFFERFDLTKDGVFELFLAGYSKKQNNSYIFVFSMNPLKLLKVQSFTHPQVCIIKYNENIRIINKFGTEMEGDIIWDGGVRFVPYTPDY